MPLLWSFRHFSFQFLISQYLKFFYLHLRRICAGIAMAERMVLFSLATLLHSFNWRLPQGEKLDLEEKFGIVLSKRKSQNGGVMPTAAELFLQSHSKKKGFQRVLSTDKAKKVHAEYETRVSEYKEQGVEKESNAIFYEVVGGHKKGHVYGLGDSAALYFEHPSAKRSSTLLRPPLDHIREIERARDEYVQMTIGLTQEREKINEGWEILRKEKEEWSRHMAEEREMIFGLRKHYHSLMRHIGQLESEDRCRDHFAPTRRDPFDGNSGASSFFPIS